MAFIEISDQFSNELDLYTKKLLLTKSEIISNALQKYLTELDENIRDYEDAMQTLAEGNKKTYSFEEVLERNNLTKTDLTGMY